MFNTFRRASVAGATALALGSYAIAVPVANAEEKTDIDLPLACNLQLAEPVGYLVGKFRGEIEGVYNAGRERYNDFQITIGKTSAPDTVEVGEEFDYVIEPGTIGVPARINSKMPADISRVSQLNMWFDIPEGAELIAVESEGGGAGLKAVKEGNKVRVWNPNGADVTTWSKANARGFRHGGAEAKKSGNKYTFDMPKITLRLKATGSEGATIQPRLTESDASGWYPDAPVQFFGDASAMGMSANGFIRCGLSEDDTYWPNKEDSDRGRGLMGKNVPAEKFSAVQITAASKTVAQPIRVKVQDYNGQPFAEGDIATLKVNNGPAREYKVGKNSTVILPNVELPVGKEAEITVSAPVFDENKTRQTKTVTPTDPPTPLVFTLTRPHLDTPMPVRFTATDHAGRPLANTDLTVTVNGQAQQVKTDGVGVANLNVPLKENQKATIKAKVGNSDEVTQEITGVAPPKKIQTTNIALQTKADKVDSQVRVRVLNDQGAPAADGTQVQAQIKNAAGEVVKTDTETTTGGFATVTNNVDEGTQWSVTVSLPSDTTAAPQTANVRAAKGATAPTLTLAPELNLEEDTTQTITKNVTVHVLDASGKPAANQTVSLKIGDAAAKDVPTDANGEYTEAVELNQGATRAVTATLAGNDAVTATGTIVGTQTAADTELNLNIPMKEVERKITIKVVDHKGQPVNDAVIEVSSAGQTGPVVTGRPTPETGFENATGERVIIRTIPENESHVIALSLQGIKPEGGELTPVEALEGNDRVVTFSGEGDDQVVEYKLEAPRATKNVTVNVKDAEGKNVPTGTEVVLTGENFTERRGFTDAEGNVPFAIEVAENGEDLNLNAALADNAEVAKDFTLNYGSDAAQTVELQLPKTDEETDPEQPNPEQPEVKTVLAKVKNANGTLLFQAGDTVKVKIDGREVEVTADADGNLPIELPADAPQNIDIEVNGVKYQLNTASGEVTAKQETPTPSLKCENPKDLVAPVVGLILGAIIGIGSQFEIPGLKQAITNLQKQMGLFNPQLAGAVERGLPAVGGLAGLAAAGGSIYGIVKACKPSLVEGSSASEGTSDQGSSASDND